MTPTDCFEQMLFGGIRSVSLVIRISAQPDLGTGNVAVATCQRNHVTADERLSTDGEYAKQSLPLAYAFLRCTVDVVADVGEWRIEVNV